VAYFFHLLEKAFDTFLEFPDRFKYKLPRNRMLTIIIPSYNEADQIGLTLRHLLNPQDRPWIAQILVADGGSKDNTGIEAQQAGAELVRCAQKGRAAQLNAAARLARTGTLYFLHADSRPPLGFALEILQAVRQGERCGCYRLRFDHGHWFLRLLGWCTRFDIAALRYGDQSLFVQKDFFEQIGGYDEELTLMEDYDIVRRLRSLGRFRILPRPLTTSARKYLRNGIYYLQAVFILIYLLHKIGLPQPKLVRTYQALIRQDKI